MSAMTTGRWATRRHHHGRRKGWLLVATTSLVAAALSAAPASAAAPANDSIANAVAIGVGSTVTADTREATADSQEACGLAATVWYVLRPTESDRLLVDVTDSSYETSVAVVTGTLGALEVRKCKYERAFVLPVDAGTTYYLGVGSCCYNIEDEDAPEVQVGPGGDLVLRLLEAPPEVKVRGTVDATGVATRLGAARLGGSVECTRRSTAYVGVIIRQRQGDRIVTAGRGRAMPCTARPRRWKVTMLNEAYAFRTGVALVRYTVRACDGLTCDRTRGRRVVRLRAG